MPCFTKTNALSYSNKLIFMLKEEAQEQQKGVIITVYVQSLTIRSNNPLKSIKPNPFAKKPPTARTGGYDRRAQLLAYARELRYANSQPLQWPRNNLRPKPKIWRWATLPARIRESLCRVFHRRWRYERIVSKETTDVDQSCGPKCINWSKTKATKRCNSQFCRKLRCMLKGFACQSNKGGV